MSDFKYLNVVNDGTSRVQVKSEPVYRVLEFQYDDHNRSLIEPLHGTTPEMAAQRYLFDHSREFMVRVRVMLPEFKYEKFNDILMTRNPAIQKMFKETETL
jgi:hypothetical protein